MLTHEKNGHHQHCAINKTVAKQVRTRTPPDTRAMLSSRPLEGNDTNEHNESCVDTEQQTSRERAPDITADVTGIGLYTPFPVHVLPRIVRNFVAAAAESIGCDTSFVALPMLVCLARAIGNRRVIELKSTWQEPAVLWAAIVGPSGSHKTPASQISLQFAKRQDAALVKQHKEALTEYAPRKLRYDRDLKQWQKGRSEAPPPSPPEEPACERFATDDATIEAIVDRLAHQFDGILVYPDELAGWFGSFAQYKRGKGSDLGFWLASWTGIPHTVDRKTGTQKIFHIQRAAVCLVGGVQPKVLRTAIGKEHLQDGLCARLLMAWPPSRPRKWVDATLSQRIENAMIRVFDNLVALKPGIDKDCNQVPIALRMSSLASRLFVEEFAIRGAEMEKVDDDLRAALSKLEAYTARFALIFQLCSAAAGEEGASGTQVGERSMRCAIQLARWFEGEAQRVYRLLSETGSDSDERELVELIQRRGGRITVRQLARGNRKYRHPGGAAQALERLIEVGLGDWACDDDDGNGPQYFVLGRNRDEATC
jgi:hypothetical protein